MSIPSFIRIFFSPNFMSKAGYFSSAVPIPAVETFAPIFSRKVDLPDPRLPNTNNDKDDFEVGSGSVFGPNIQADSIAMI